MRPISGHIRANLVAYLALFFALGGTAVASHEQIFSSDIVNGEVKNADLAVNAVASGKIADRQVKNADLSIGASASNTIADGGVRGVDVKDDSVTGAQIDESSLDKVPDADSLDGIDSSRFIQGAGRVFGGSGTAPAGSFVELISLTDTGGLSSHHAFSLGYDCPPDSANNSGGLGLYSYALPDPVQLFVDNGSGNPSFSGSLGFGHSHWEAAAASGEQITIQAGYTDGSERIVTVNVFSRHASDSCYAQAQAVVTKP